MLLRRKLEQVNLHQQVKDKMEELKCDFITLCRISHVGLYGTDPDQTQSYLNWKQNGIIPIFVEKWIHEQS